MGDVGDAFEVPRSPELIERQAAVLKRTGAALEQAAQVARDEATHPGAVQRAHLELQETLAAVHALEDTGHAGGTPEIAKAIDETLRQAQAHLQAAADVLARLR